MHKYNHRKQTYLLAAIGAILVYSIFTRLLRIHIGDAAYVPALLMAAAAALPVLRAMLVPHQVRLFGMDLLMIGFAWGVAIAMSHAVYRSSFYTETGIILHVGLPVMFYVLARDLRIELRWFLMLFALFGLVYDLYMIAEFLAYEWMPETRVFIRNYFQTVGVDGQESCRSFPLLPGNSHCRAFGPLFEQSASAVPSVWFFFFYLLSGRLGLPLPRWAVALLAGLSLLAIYVGLSKTAFALLAVSLLVYALLFAPEGRWRKWGRTAILVGTVGAVAGFVKFFLFDTGHGFNVAKAHRYLEGFFLFPLQGMYYNLVGGLPSAVVGCGVGLSCAELRAPEIGMLKNMVKFGGITVLLFEFMMLRAIHLTWHRLPAMAFLLVVILLSQMHYPVVLKYPSSLIVFVLLAVIVHAFEMRPAEIAGSARAESGSSPGGVKEQRG
ncbi:hypothetical protein [Endothiovibrio diazotrophicus]